MDATKSQLNRIVIGDWILVGFEGKALANEVTFGRPNGKLPAEPHQVKAIDTVRDEWSSKTYVLTLDDGRKTQARYGTTHVYTVAAPPSQASKGTAKVPVTLHASDAQGDAALEGEVDEAVLGQIPCPQCKGYGLVRKRGQRAGEKYKTLNGAMAADANGNAVTCPVCKGAALVAA